MVWGAGDVCGYDDLGGAGVRYRGRCIGVSSDGGIGNGAVGGDAGGQKTGGGGRRTTSEVVLQECSSLRQRVGIPAGTVRGASVLGSARPSIDDSSNTCDNERSDYNNNNNNNNDNNNSDNTNNNDVDCDSDSTFHPTDAGYAAPSDPTIVSRTCHCRCGCGAGSPRRCGSARVEERAGTCLATSRRQRVSRTTAPYSQPDRVG